MSEANTIPLKITFDNGSIEALANAINKKTKEAENESKSTFDTLNTDLSKLAKSTAKAVGALGLEAGKEYESGFAAGLQGVEKTVTNLSNTFSAFSDFKGSLDWPKTTGLTFIQ